MVKSKNSTQMLPWLAATLAVLLLAAAGVAYVGQSQGRGRPGDDGSLIAIVMEAREQARGALAGEAGALAALTTSRAQIASWNSESANIGGPVVAEIGEFVSLLDQFLAYGPSLTAVDEAVERVQGLAPQFAASTRSLFNAPSIEDREINQPFVEWFDQTVMAMQFALSGRGIEQRFADTVVAVTGSASYAAEIVGGLAGTTDGLGIRPVANSADPVDLQTATRNMGEIELAVQTIAENAAQIELAESSYAEIDAASGTFGQRIRTAAATGEAGPPIVLLTLLGAALLVLALMMFTFRKARELSKSADAHAAQNDRNQHAILRLLDELSSLADGDLTVQATVTEDITGAIADSINYAIEALRDLVLTIKQSSLLLDGAAKQSEATAHHLVRASETQAKQAVAASNSITKMAASIAEVSNNAERCSDVARHAVEVSHKGGEAVRRTIEGMNTIRETIQDTSKRIKRLGESSQEIGNIVELIEEIAEQTNILALNASIEASRAGEASRGFAVVADEVQKLAERSTAATRKIEVLVSTIQSDTNEAIVSMERSTTDVVGGALLAENAGAALDEIEQVSHQIANLLQNISGSAREQTGVASAISKNMDVLKEISSRSKQSTTAASSSISKLSELASQLRATVSGFALPDDGRGPAVLAGLESPGVSRGNTQAQSFDNKVAAKTKDSLSGNEGMPVQPAAAAERR